MLYGSEDTTVSTDDLDHLLQKRESGGEFGYESFEYNAPHAILQSDEADLVVAQIVEILTRTAAEQ